MRVLVVSEAASAGVGRHVIDLCLGLLRGGDEVHLIYSNGRIDPQFERGLDQLDAAGVVRFEVGMRRAPHTSDVAALRRLRQHLREHGPFDVVHGQSSKGGALVRLARRDIQGAVVYTPHCIYTLNPTIRGWQRSFYRRAELWLARRTDAIIAVSPSEEEHLVATGFPREIVHVVPNGVALPAWPGREAVRARLRCGADDRVVGFLGRLSEQKDPMLMLEAFAGVAAAIDRAVLVVGGSGDLAAALRERSRALGLEERVRWLGHVDPGDVLPGVDVFAVSSRYEGMPYVYLEALVCGLPIVSTQVGGVELAIEADGNGIVVPRGDEKALAGALTRVLRDDALRAAMAQASLQRAQRFTLDEMLRETKRVYEAAIAARYSGGRRMTAAGHPDALPLAVRAMIFLCLASSGFVLFEPAPTDLFFLLLLIAMFVWRVPLRFDGISAGVIIGVLMFLWGNGVSLMAAERVTMCVRYLAITGYLFVAFFAFAGLIGRHGPEVARFALRAFCVAAFVTALIGILARFHLIPNAEVFFRDSSGLRIRSTFKDANVLAPFLVAGALVVLGEYLMRRRTLWNACFVGVTLLLAILFAFSRGAFLHLAVSVAVYVFVSIFVIRRAEISRRLVAGLAAAGVVTVLAVVYALAFSGLGDFLQQRLAVQGYDTERFAMQELTLHVSLENPLGIGPGEWDNQRFQNDPHNVYLRVLAENGILSLIGWIVWCGACLVTAFLGAKRRGPEAPTYAVCLAVLSGLFVESLFIDSLHWRHLFLFAAVPVGLQVAERAAAATATAAAASGATAPGAEGEETRGAVGAAVRA